jgi:hypothetical protein
LSRSTLLELFKKNKMHLDVESNAVAQNPIFVFSKQERESEQPGQSGGDDVAT